jgi:diacylglycerol kinase (ATP)
MATCPTVVIWNANAGSVEQAALVRAQLEARPDTQVHESTSPEEAQQIVADACQSGDVLIVAAGGDGTINTVVNALPKYESHIRLGVLPVGTANDWSWSLGMPDDLSQAVQLLDQGETRLLDLAEMETDTGNYCFANVATGGNSQRVTDLLTDDIKQRWGALCYLRGAVEVVGDLQTFSAQVEFPEGTIEEHSVWNMIVANGRTSAGRLQVAPRADMEDGLLDVIIIRDGDLIDFAQLAAGFALTGDYTELEQVKIRRVKEFKLHGSTNLKFSLDGNFIEYAPRGFRVLPKAFSVIVGPEYETRRQNAIPG